MLVLLILVVVGYGQWSIVGKKRELPTFFGFSPQGVACDDTFVYFSGKRMLRKTSVTLNDSLSFTTVAINEDAIPKKTGLDHIGDIDEYLGMIIAPIETKTLSEPVFAWYYAGNLSYADRMVVTPQSHCPWVAVDPSSRIMYSSEFDNVTSLFSYNVTTGAFIGTLRLTNLPANRPLGLMACQGGVVSDGTLYISSSSRNQPTTMIRLMDGKVLGYFNTSTTHENEGLTITTDGKNMYQGAYMCVCCRGGRALLCRLTK